MSAPVHVSREIAATPEQLYAMVSDVTRMGEWSPETTSCRWSRGVDGPAVGATFWGVNRNGWHRWATFCRVTAADPGRRFAFDVMLGLPIANWAFDLEPTDTGCRVTQTWVDRRGWLYRNFGKVADGVRSRAEHNPTGMQQTLDRLAAVAEGSA